MKETSGSLVLVSGVGTQTWITSAAASAVKSVLAANRPAATWLLHLGRRHVADVGAALRQRPDLGSRRGRSRPPGSPPWRTPARAAAPRSRARSPRCAPRGSRSARRSSVQPRSSPRLACRSSRQSTRSPTRGSGPWPRPEVPRRAHGSGRRASPSGKSRQPIAMFWAVVLSFPCQPGRHHLPAGRGDPAQPRHGQLAPDHHDDQDQPPARGCAPSSSSTISAVGDRELVRERIEQLPDLRHLLPAARGPAVEQVTERRDDEEPRDDLRARPAPRRAGTPTSTGTTAMRTTVMVLGRFQKRSRAGAAPGASGLTERSRHGTDDST